jgi:hypothetical protein
VCENVNTLGINPDPLRPIELVRIAPDALPQLFVIVDTEEEFDWNAPFSRTNASVRAMRHIDRLQNVVSTRQIVPTYVVDFPIASTADGFAPLKEFADQGRARIGAHLHPWVNPPLSEELTKRNSFGCCLGVALETEKMRVLSNQIAARAGTGKRRIGDVRTPRRGAAAAARRTSAVLRD